MSWKWNCWKSDGITPMLVNKILIFMMTSYDASKRWIANVGLTACRQPRLRPRPSPSRSDIISVTTMNFNPSCTDSTYSIVNVRTKDAGIYDNKWSVVRFRGFSIEFSTEVKMMKNILCKLCSRCFPSPRVVDYHQTDIKRYSADLLAFLFIQKQGSSEKKERRRD